MQFLLDKNLTSTLFEQAHEQLIAALHTGKIRTGDRLPSVRKVALSNHINIKTAFSIYQQLKEEGYVTLRSGSGAYVADFDQSDLEQAYCLSLFNLIKSNLFEAQRLKLDPDKYSDLLQSFINKPQLESASLAVVECNEEQVNVFASEISGRLHARVFPLLLNQLEAPDNRARKLMEQASYFVTTDFHFKQVKDLIADYRKKVLKLRLNPTFIPSIIEAAHAGRVLMVVSDTGYFPAFCRSLQDIGVKRNIIERISAIDCRHVSRLRAEISRSQSVYISAICDPQLRRLVPAHVRELEFDGLLSSESLDMLQAVILFHNYIAHDSSP